MKITAECIPCFLYRALYESKLVQDSEEKSWEVVRSMMELLNHELPRDGNLDELPVSAEVATILHRKTYDIIGSDDPYHEMKKASNEVALELLPEAEKFVDRAKDGFQAAATCAIVGNLLDFGLRSSDFSPDKMAEEFHALVEEGIQVNHLPRLKEMLQESGEVLYLIDNCGEIVFDTLLFRELRKMGVRIYLVVRGAPILTDATLEDVEELGLRELVDEVYTTGTYAVGVNFEKLPDEVKALMDRKVPILAKGMANYESFSDTGYRPIAYLMRTKCEPVARSMGFKKGWNLAALYE